MTFLVTILFRTFFYVRMVVRAILSPSVMGACALVERDGKVLLIRQSYTTGWHLPGGGVGLGEPPAEALLRELREEIGLVSSAAPEFFGLYVRRVLWVSSFVAVYRVPGAVFDFKPNWEIRAARFVEPANPDDTVGWGTRRRLAELAGLAVRSPYW
jgi:8-oxo-dGTP pyrophosphatase MutT (NUDIX family)